MKGRIGKYKDKIVVWGDPNLTAKNEINIDSLGGGEGQADIPIEYYKVVAPEGENLDDVRRDVFDAFNDLIGIFSCFYILAKGTSLSHYRLFAGTPLTLIGTQEGISVHAYAIRSFKVIFKTVDTEGTLREVPSFNNIFDAFDFLQPGMSLQLKQHLVPITAEEFYNLDDLK